MTFCSQKELVYRWNTWPCNIFKYISVIWFEMVNWENEREGSTKTGLIEDKKHTCCELYIHTFLRTSQWTSYPWLHSCVWSTESGTEDAFFSASQNTRWPANWCWLVNEEASMSPWLFQLRANKPGVAREGRASLVGKTGEGTSNANYNGFLKN